MTSKEERYATIPKWQEAVDKKLNDHLPLLITMLKGANLEHPSPWHQVLRRLAEAEKKLDINKFLPKHLRSIIMAWKALKQSEISQERADTIINKLNDIPGVSNGN